MAVNDDSEIYAVDRIIGRRISLLRGTEYLILWKGYKFDESTWEKEDATAGCRDAVEDFEKRCAALRRQISELPDINYVDRFENMGVASIVDDALYAFGKHISVFLEADSETDVDEKHCSSSIGWKTSRSPGMSNKWRGKGGYHRVTVATHGWNRAQQTDGGVSSADSTAECTIKEINGSLTDPALRRYYLVTWSDGQVTWEKPAAFDKSLVVLERYEITRERLARQKLCQSLQRKAFGQVPQKVAHSANAEGSTKDSYLDSGSDDDYMLPQSSRDSGDESVGRYDSDDPPLASALGISGLDDLPLATIAEMRRESKQMNKGIVPDKVSKSLTTSLLPRDVDSDSVISSDSAPAVPKSDKTESRRPSAEGCNMVPKSRAVKGLEPGEVEEVDEVLTSGSICAKTSPGGSISSVDSASQPGQRACSPGSNVNNGESGIHTLRCGFCDSNPAGSDRSSRIRQCRLCTVAYHEDCHRKVSDFANIRRAPTTHVSQTREGWSCNFCQSHASQIAGVVSQWVLVSAESTPPRITEKHLSRVAVRVQWSGDSARGSSWVPYQWLCNNRGGINIAHVRQVILSGGSFAPSAKSPNDSAHAKPCIPLANSNTPATASSAKPATTVSPRSRSSSAVGQAARSGSSEIKYMVGITNRSSHSVEAHKRSLEIDRLDLDKDGIHLYLYVEQASLIMKPPDDSIVASRFVPDPRSDRPEFQRWLAAYKKYKAWRAVDMHAWKRWVHRPDASLVGAVRKVESASCVDSGRLSGEEGKRVEWLLSAWMASKSAVLNIFRDIRSAETVAAFISAATAIQPVHRMCNPNASACAFGMVPYLILVPRGDVSAWAATFERFAPNVVVGELYGHSDTLRTLLENRVFSSHCPSDAKPLLACHVVIAEFEAIRNTRVDSMLGSTSIVWQSIIAHDAFTTDKSFLDCCRRVNQFTSRQRVLVGTSEPPKNVADLHMVLKFLDPKQYYSEESVQRKFGLSGDSSKASIISCAKEFVLKHVVDKLSADNAAPDTILRVDRRPEGHRRTAQSLPLPATSHRSPSADSRKVLQSDAAGSASTHRSDKLPSPASTRVTRHVAEQPTAVVVVPASAVKSASATMDICPTPVTPASVANPAPQSANSHAASPSTNKMCFFDLVIPVGMSKWQRMLYQSIIQKNRALLRLVGNVLLILENQNLGDDQRKASMTQLRRQLSPSCGKDLERAAIRRGANKSRGGLHAGSFNVLMDLLLEALKATSHPYLINGSEIALSSASERRNILIESSTKLSLLNRLLPRLLAQKRRVAIIAQYLGTLDIIEEYLRGSKVEFLRIDGSLQQSVIQERADHFNTKHSPVSVMISSTMPELHSPSLVTADTVIFFESSVSADVDRAALERVAGPGQGEFVWVLRLVARDTVDGRLVRHYLGTKSRITIEGMSDSDVTSHVQAISIALGSNIAQVIDASYIDKAGLDSELAGAEYAAKIVDCCLRVSVNQESATAKAIRKSAYSQESFSSVQTDAWVLSSDSTPVHITTGHPINFPAAKQTADMLHRKTAKRKATVSATGASTSSDIPAPDADRSAKQLKLTTADVTDQRDICGGDIEMSSAPDAIMQPRAYDSVSAHEVPPSLKPVTVCAEELPVIMDIFIDRLAEIYKSRVSSKERALTSDEDATIRALFAEMFDQNLYTPTAASASRTPCLFFPVLTNLSLVPHGQPMPCQPPLSSDCPVCRERTHDVSFCPVICEPLFISGVNKLKSTRRYDIHPFYMNLMSWYSIQYVWYYLGSTEGAAANARNVKLHPEYAVDARPYVTLARLQLCLLQTFQSASTEEMAQSCMEKYSEIVAAAVEKGTGIVDEMTVTDVPALQRSLSELNGMRARLLHQIRDGSNKRLGESDVSGAVTATPSHSEVNSKGLVLCCECLSIKARRTEARITILQMPLGVPPTTTVLAAHPASAPAKPAVDFAPLLNIVPNFDPVMRSRVSESVQLFDSLVALGKRSAKSGTTVRADIDSLVKLSRSWGGNLGTWLSSSPKSLNALRTIHSKCDRAAKKYVENTGRPQPRVAELTHLLVKQLSTQAAPAKPEMTAVATQKHAVADSAVEVSAETPKHATAEIPSSSYLSDSKMSAASISVSIPRPNPALAGSIQLLAKATPSAASTTDANVSTISPTAPSATLATSATSVAIPVPNRTHSLPILSGSGVSMQLPPAPTIHHNPSSVTQAGRASAVHPASPLGSMAALSPSVISNMLVSQAQQPTVLASQAYGSRGSSVGRAIDSRASSATLSPIDFNSLISQATSQATSIPQSSHDQRSAASVVQPVVWPTTSKTQDVTILNQHSQIGNPGLLTLAGTYASFSGVNSQYQMEPQNPSKQQVEDQMHRQQREWWRYRQAGQQQYQQYLQRELLRIENQLCQQWIVHYVDNLTAPGKIFYQQLSSDNQILYLQKAIMPYKPELHAQAQSILQQYLSTVAAGQGSFVPTASMGNAQTLAAVQQQRQQQQQQAQLFQQAYSMYHSQPQPQPQPQQQQQQLVQSSQVYSPIQQQPLTQTPMSMPFSTPANVLMATAAQSPIVDTPAAQPASSLLSSGASVSAAGVLNGVTYCTLCNADTHRPEGCDRRTNRGFLVGRRMMVRYDNQLSEGLREMAIAVIEKYLRRLGWDDNGQDD